MCRRRIGLVLFIGVVALALGGGAAAQDSTLVGYWKLDEISGSIAADSSGNGHNGTLHGSPQWVTGKSRGGLQFNGISDYVDTSYTENLTKWTVCVWVTSPAAPANAFASGPVHRDQDYQFNWNHTVESFRGAAALMVAGAWTSASFGTLEADTWYYLTGTYDGTSLKAYVNGELISTVGVAGTPNAENNSLKFARHTTAPQFFAGIVDDVRVYNRALAQQEIEAVMQGGSNAGLASGPGPADRAKDVARDAVLGWAPGKFAKTHDVYFGTDFDDVTHASKANAMGVSVSGGQDANTHDPAGLLAFGQTYYWRIDEVNAPPDSTLFKGSTWTFTAETYGFPVKPVEAIASSSLSASSGPDKTIDGSGLDGLDQHSISLSDMWLSKKGVTPIWIQYGFDKTYKLYQMWVWNSNQSIEPDLGLGAKDVTIETSLDGTTWTTLDGVPEFAQATGEPNYVCNTVVDLGGVQAQYVKLTINSNWADGTKQAGLSEVRFYYVPVKAFGPTPASGAKAVAADGVLNWRPGREAAKHQVYLGTDPNALTLVQTVTPHSLGLGSLGLEYGKTYYWKVNEVNDAATPASWTGDIWSFSMSDTFVVDDFEKYNDACRRIFFTWQDGEGHNGSEDCDVAPFGGNSTGSTVGNAEPPFAEQTIVHKGRQSMPLAYDNTTGPGYSEATRTFDPVQNWSMGGAKTLVLFFHGAVDNAAAQLYVKVNNGPKVSYSGNAAALTTPLWKQWNVDLASVGGGLQAVKTLTIGVSGSGKGMVYIDDILLYRVAPAVVQPVNPGTANLAAYYPLDGSLNDSSGHGYNATMVGNQTYMDDAGYGKAIQTNGTSDYIDLPIGPLVNTLSSATIATRVDFSGTGGARQRVFAFGMDTTVYMSLAANAWTGGPLRFSITTDGEAGESALRAPATLPTGWHHVAVVIDGAAKTMQLYLDGDLVASGPTTTLPKDLGKTTQNWLARSAFTADTYFNGMLDEFRIYNRALAAGEVRYLAGDRQ